MASTSPLDPDAKGDCNTNRFGTGERHGVEPQTAPDGRDILPDHVEHVGEDDDPADARQ